RRALNGQLEQAILRHDHGSAALAHLGAQLAHILDTKPLIIGQIDPCATLNLLAQLSNPLDLFLCWHKFHLRPGLRSVQQENGKPPKTGASHSYCETSSAVRAATRWAAREALTSCTLGRSLRDLGGRTRNGFLRPHMRHRQSLVA